MVLLLPLALLSACTDAAARPRLQVLSRHEAPRACDAGTFRFGCASPAGCEVVYGAAQPVVRLLLRAGEHTAPCVACPAGSSCRGGARAPCPAGRFSAAAGRGTACAGCLAGRFAQRSGSAACASCPAGKQSSAALPAAARSAALAAAPCRAVSRGNCTCVSPCAAPAWDAAAYTCRVRSHGPLPTTPGVAAACQSEWPLLDHCCPDKRASCCVVPLLDAAALARSAATRAGCGACPRGRAGSGGAQPCAECAAGRFAARAGQRACRMCARGTVARSGGSTACSACPRGQFPHGATACRPCGVGTFANHAGECAGCPEGHFCAAGVAHECPAGHFCPRHEAGDSPAQLVQLGFTQRLLERVALLLQAVPPRPLKLPCPAGRFQDYMGKRSCKVCPAGRFQRREGGLACFGCGAGSVLAIGAGRCSACAPGRHMPASTLARSSCLGCAFPTSCLACPAGKYQPAAGAGACHGCPHGTRSAKVRDARVSCVPVTRGSRLRAAGAPPCAAGRFHCVVHQTRTCAPCPAGRWQNQPAAALCKACPRGKYQPLRSSVKCLACPRGRQQPREGASSCQRSGCPPGTEPLAAGMCVSCSGGRYNDRWVRTRMCTDCPAGRRATDNATACETGENRDRAKRPIRLPAVHAKPCKPREVLGEWSLCNRVCGGGVKFRIRATLGCGSASGPAGGFAGGLRERQRCNTSACPKCYTRSYTCACKGPPCPRTACMWQKSRIACPASKWMVAVPVPDEASGRRPES